MQYEAFYEAYENSKISVLINKEKAIKFMDPKLGLVQLMRPKRRYGYLFSKTISQLSIAVGLLTLLLLFFGVEMSILVPITMFIIGFTISASTRKSVCSFVLSEALHNKEYYEKIQTLDTKSDAPVFTIQSEDA